MKPLTIINPSHSAYPAYMSSPFRPSSSQPNFFQSAHTPKGHLILSSQANGLYSSYNSRQIQINMLNTTPQKTQHASLQSRTKSEPKFMKNHNKILNDKKNLAENHWNTLLDDDKYLRGLEAKMRVLLQENDKLLGLVEEKSREIREFQEIEGKIQVILAENARLSQILENQENDDTKNLLLAQQSQILDKRNEEIQALVKEIQLLKVFEEENAAYKANEEEYLRALHEKKQENEAIKRKLEENDKKIRGLDEKHREKSQNIKACEKNIKDLLAENERFRRFFEETDAENKEKIAYLIETNDFLNELIEEIGKKNRVLLQEKGSESQKKEEYKRKFVSLLAINEQFNETFSNLQTEREETAVIRSKVEQLIENNQSLEEAYQQKHEELLKFQRLYEELSTKYEGKSDEEIFQRTTKEEIDNLLGQFEFLRQENQQLQEKIEILRHFEQDYEVLESTTNNLLEENQRLNEHYGKIQEEYEERERELREKNEALYQEIQAISANHQEIKAELERVIYEKEEISGNLHEKCVLLLEENKKLQIVIEGKEQETAEFTAKVQDLESELEEKTCLLSEYQQKNDNICQEFEVLKEEFNQHRLSSKEENDQFLQENSIKLQKEVEILRNQNNHWKIMSETRDKEISKLYELLKARKQEHTTLLQENQEIKQELAKFQGNGASANGENQENVAVLREERDMFKEINENLKEEVKNLKELLENNAMSLEYYKSEYENSLKLMEEMKIAGNLEEEA